MKRFLSTDEITIPNDIENELIKFQKSAGFHVWEGKDIEKYAFGSNRFYNFNISVESQDLEIYRANVPDHVGMEVYRGYISGYIFESVEVGSVKTSLRMQGKFYIYSEELVSLNAEPICEPWYIANNIAYSKLIDVSIIFPNQYKGIRSDGIIQMPMSDMTYIYSGRFDNCDCPWYTHQINCTKNLKAFYKYGHEVGYRLMKEWRRLLIVLQNVNTLT